VKYFCLFLLLIAFQPCIAQATKTFVTKDGTYTDIAKDATYYVLCQKLEDSAYEVRQYTVHDEIIMRGYYKDSSFAIQNGKFTYYEKPRVNKNLPSLNTDTSSYIKSTGYYLNGVKTGKWIVYLFRNIIDYICIYEHSKLNGLCQEYYTGHNQQISQEGNFINDEREGEWNSYDTLKNSLVTVIYLHNKIVNEIYHTRRIIPPVHFQESMHNSLGKMAHYEGMLVSFKVDTDGSVKDFEFDMNISAIKEKMIADAIIESGKFQPALQNDRPIIAKFTWHIWKSAPGNFDAREDKLMRGYSKHADLIGRGLNTMGIGTPIKDDN
jgi:antitoxin component YwqK of YwqJK toxin-antitoxin module